MFIIVIPFARLAERDVTRTTFKGCRKFCSFAFKPTVTAHVASLWCTDLQQRVLLDWFLCDLQQASRFNCTERLVSCDSSCSCHLKLKMWQRWIWNPKIPANCLRLGFFVCQTSSSAQLPDWKWLCTSITTACFRYCSATWGRCTNPWCFVFLGRPGIAVELVNVKSFVCKSTNLTACRLVPSIISVVQDCHSPLCKQAFLKSARWKFLCAVLTSIIQKSPRFRSSTAAFTELNQLSATTLLQLPW